MASAPKIVATSRTSCGGMPPDAMFQISHCAPSPLELSVAAQSHAAAGGNDLRGLRAKS